MSQTPQGPQVGQVSNGYQWNGQSWVPLSQATSSQQQYQVGQVVNGHRWDGQQWVPVAQAQAQPQYQVGQVVNGHQWNGQEWVPVAQAQPQYQVGQVVNGHRWDGQQWVPVAQAQEGPQVGQVQNGYQWDGQQWVPMAQQGPQVGEVQNGYRWNGTQWEPMAQSSPASQWGQPEAEQAAEQAAPGVEGRLRALAESWQFSWSESGQEITITKVLAERSSVLARQKLEYRATIAIDDAKWQLRYRDSLKETSSGLSSGDSEDGAGFGFSGGAYASSGAPGLGDDIAEQVVKYGKDYTFDFPYEQWREQVRMIAAETGYDFVTGA